MTQPEAEALAAKLVRVWTPEDGSPLPTLPLVFKDLGKWEIFKFTCELSADTFIETSLWEGLLTVDIYRRTYREDVNYGIHADPETGEFELYPAAQNNNEAALMQKFADEVTPFLRRGCWRLGFPIEANMHEKLEWMQGLTREEIEAWNLHI